MDVHDKKTRSYNMSRIKGKNTKPEIYFRKNLFARGYHYRVNTAGIPGHPDIWLPKYNTAIFINGCFWHRHSNCKYAYIPKTRVEFWSRKFSANVARDQIVKEELRNRNIKCLIIWEYTIKMMLKDKVFESQILNACERFLQTDSLTEEM